MTGFDVQRFKDIVQHTKDAVKHKAVFASESRYRESFDGLFRKVRIESNLVLGDGLQYMRSPGYHSYPFLYYEENKEKLLYNFHCH